MGAVAAFVAQRVLQAGKTEFSMWLYWVAIGLVGIASLYHLAPRKNGKVVATPFGLDVYGPAGAAAFIGFVAYQWVKDDNTASVLSLTLAVGAFAVLAWGYYLAAQKRGRDFQLLRDRLLLVIGVGAGVGYANYGHLHFNNFIHNWDTYHYYIGAKYFPEVGYDRMYECAITADAEDFPPEKLAKMREQRIVTNLRTNIMEKVGETVLLHPEDCKNSFTAARWVEFKKDIAWFRGRVNDKRWEEIHHDHGYNASPVWTLLGWVVTNTGQATLNQIVFVDLFDPLYLALMAAMIWWAFGPRVFAVALIMLGTNWASRFFYWTGGALLRHDWLFYTVAVVCLLKKGKPFLAGMALSYAALLRLFPGLMLLGPVLAAAEYARLRLRPSRGEARPEEEPRKGVDAKLPRWLDPQFARFIAGGALATVVLFGASLQFFGGIDTWKKFAANTSKHAATPLTNHMGLRTVVSYRPWTTGQWLRDAKQLDAWQPWKDGRVEVFKASRPFFALALVAALALLYFAIRGTKGLLWASAAMGAGVIAVAGELTNYYYVFFVAVALVHELKREAGMFLCAMVATSIFVMLTPFLGMSGWQDEQSVAMSLVSLIGIGGVWWIFTPWGAKYSVEPEAPVQLLPELQPAAPAGAASKKKKR